MALVDVPFLVLQPTHNKQDFADSKEYRHLLKVLGSYMDHYWEEAQKAELKNVTDFWEKYGYVSNKSILAPPSTEMKFMRQRAMVVKTTIQVRCIWFVLVCSYRNCLGCLAFAEMHRSLFQPPVFRFLVQCDECLKWRVLEFSLQSVSKPLPEKWTCSMNNDIKHKTCTGDLHPRIVMAIYAN